MKILFLHGWHSVPGGVKPTYLTDHGHTVVNPKLPDDDFAEAVRIAHRLADPVPLEAMLEACETPRPAQFAALIWQRTPLSASHAANFATPSFSKILNNSANTPSPRQNPYTLNSATNATLLADPHQQNAWNHEEHQGTRRKRQ